MRLSIDRKKVKKIVNAAIIVLIIVVICIVVFLNFRISTGANSALRKAKNIKLSFISVDIEYYGKNMSIYDPERAGRMSEGVEDRIKNDLEEDGEFEITSYDSKARKVTGMRYIDGHYLVEYKHDEHGDHWTVDYLYNVIGKNVEVKKSSDID